MDSTLAFAERGAPVASGIASPASRVAFAAALIALASVLGLVEAALPPLAVVPWLKPGLANIAVVMALSASGPFVAGAVSGGRIVIIGLATGTLAGPASGMAFAGAAASLFVMWGLSRAWGSLSPVGWSAAGSAAHVCAQLLAAATMLDSPSLLALIPGSVLIALPLGALIGSLARYLVSRLPWRQA
jgi:uncharacterized membrane protein